MEGILIHKYWIMIPLLHIQYNSSKYAFSNKNFTLNKKIPFVANKCVVATVVAKAIFERNWIKKNNESDPNI